MKNLLYNTSIYKISLSIGSSWIWAPAILLSSQMAYYNGLMGFLLFFVMNVLTLIIFGYVSDYVKNKNSHNTTLLDIIKNKTQKMCHSVYSIIFLMCAIIVQLVGIKMILPQWYISFILLLIMISTVFVFGFKISIITDILKYIIVTAGVGILLFVATDISNLNVSIYGVAQLTILDMMCQFGITFIISLIFAPYIDQMLWQLGFSSNNTKLSFFYGSLFYSIIPIMCATIAFCSYSSSQTWNIISNFNYNSYYSIIISFIILVSLTSIIDSCINAIRAILNTYLQPNKNLILSASIILSSLLIVEVFDPNILTIFLIYGTIRISAGCAQLLTIYDMHNKYIIYTTTLSIIIGLFLCIFFNYYDKNMLYISSLVTLLTTLLGMNIKQLYIKLHL